MTRTEYEQHARRIATTRGKKYCLMLVPVGDGRCDIKEYIGDVLQALHTNIPVAEADQEFDTIIREAALYDNIKFIEK